MQTGRKENKGRTGRITNDAIVLGPVYQAQDYQDVIGVELYNIFCLRRF